MQTSKLSSALAGMSVQPDVTNKYWPKNLKKMTVKPLEDIAGVDLSTFAAPAERLLELTERPSFSRVKAFFEGYPERSLSIATDRAFMHCLVRAVRPALFVEIGTYYAGMTEVVARAMLNNYNGGHLLTIDPFGNYRVPGILESWPDDLKGLVSYLPLDSMGLYTEVDTLGTNVDVCFIDGNHLYEFAFYDLNCMSQRMRPGGIIIMDDFDQPGVFWATKHFLGLNPGWREIGGVFDNFDPNTPFESIRPSVSGTNFLVLAAPDLVEIGDNLRVFEYDGIRETAMMGYGLRLAPGNAPGRLHTKIYLRSFYVDDSHGDPQQLEVLWSADITAGEGEQAVLFEAPLATDYDQALSNRQLEINLVWSPADSRSPLRLMQRPEPMMVS